MVTPIIVIILLFAPLAVGRYLQLRDLVSRGEEHGAAIGLALCFLYFALGHFVRTDEMVTMLPFWLPLRYEIVSLTGIAEIVAALALLHPGSRRKAGVACVIMLIAFFPANVYAAYHQLGMGGHQWGLGYLLLRLPLQLLLIWFAAHFLLSSPERLRRSRA